MKVCCSSWRNARCTFRSRGAGPASELSFHRDEPGSIGGIRVAIVTTLRAIPAPMLESFIMWHLSIGFACLYLYFDDEEDQGIEVARLVGRKLLRLGRKADCVRVIPCDSQLRHEWSTLQLYDKWGRQAETMVEVSASCMREHLHQERRRRD